MDNTKVTCGDDDYNPVGFAMLVLWINFHGLDTYHEIDEILYTKKFLSVQCILCTRNIVVYPHTNKIF